VAGATLSLVLWLATVPFYYFATPGASHHIRIEGGRINYRYDPAGIGSEDNGIAPNSEPMRWAPAFSAAGSGWRIRLPLWIPFTLCAAGAAALFMVPRLRRPRGHCPNCRYPLAGLSPTADGAITCPECAASVPAAQARAGAQ
jgi:hypothetical protein